MSARNAVPSVAQQEKLLECLEEKPWLATGYARTANARDRTRAAWQEIATTLNSDGRRCIKSWDKWAKYWKDKKSAVKKKYSQIRLARQRTGGGAAEDVVLSAIEERLLAVAGGEGYAIGDRALEIDPFHQIPDPPTAAPSDPAQEVQDAVQLNIQELVQDSGATHASNSESILQNIQSMAVEPGTSAAAASPLIEEDTSIPPTFTEPTGNIEPPTQQLTQDRPGPAHEPVAPSATSSPRRRRLRARRGLLRRSPPSQRQSQLASLTERFIAIEERRVETEQTLAENQRELINVLRQISEAWSRQSQALQDLINRLSS